MSNSLPTRLPVAVKLGVPLAAALLAAACGSSSSSSQAGATPGTGSSAGASGSGTVITTSSVSAGSFLTDGSGRAVYLWTKDSMNKSECSGACAGHWSPVPAKGAVTASGSAQASDLGSITRSDGSKQVTYDGHPLYYYLEDSGPGQANGQGSDDFGAKWWLVAPSGTQVTAAVTSFTPNAPAAPAAPASPASPTPTKSSAGGGWS